MKIGNHEIEFVEHLTKKISFVVEKAQFDAEKSGDAEIVADAMTMNLVSRIYLVSKEEVTVNGKKETSFKKEEMPKSEWQEFFDNMSLNDFAKLMEGCKNISGGKVADKKKS